MGIVQILSLQMLYDTIVACDFPSFYIDFGGWLSVVSFIHFVLFGHTCASLFPFSITIKRKAFIWWLNEILKKNKTKEPTKHITSMVWMDGDPFRTVD